MSFNNLILTSIKPWKSLIFITYFFTTYLSATTLEQAVYQTLHTNPEIKNKVLAKHGLATEVSPIEKTDETKKAKKNLQ